MSEFDHRTLRERRKYGENTGSDCCGATRGSVSATVWPDPAKGAFKQVPVRFRASFDDVYRDLTERGYRLFYLDPGLDPSLDSAPNHAPGAQPAPGHVQATGGA